MLKKKFTLPRYIAALGLVFTILILSISYYLEYYRHLTPCPLCLMQRFTFILISLILLIQIIHNPLKKKTAIIYGALVSFLSILGALIASRQIWLQHLPKDQVPPCGPDIYTLMNYAPLKHILNVLFYGSGDCAKIDWTFLSLPLSQWGLISFLLLLTCSISIIMKSKH